jgi:hypothetical protein
MLGIASDPACSLLCRRLILPSLLAGYRHGVRGKSDDGVEVGARRSKQVVRRYLMFRR